MKAEAEAPSNDTQTTPPIDEAKPDPSNSIVDALVTKDWKTAEKVLKEQVPILLEEHRKTSNLDNYHPLLFLDQSNTIGEDHADRMYSAICECKEEKDVLLILNTRGGRIEPAYLISKNCKAKAKTRFVVVVPRRAKSAGTLLSLGADEIHMGAMSELGPIDPQLGRIPALSLTNALQTLARLVTEHPSSADMFAKFLQSQLDLGMLGYFERINESAVQYASRLLHGKKLGQGQTPQKLASHLVNHYKDHSFVIDKDEAIQLFGPEVIKVQTNEYIFANRLDQHLRLLSRLAKWFHKREITFVGSFSSCLKIRDIEEKDG